ncbi:MAG: undecaprenyldiphospho-muramoylpentapeptide beta-N-acetylglucosaminyltransferase [Acidobacteria bacterium]|nr:undecaprenyldiphospho-muramoylpentapeptide beta-N-acetylglucosaminyltransferase [Acidobacteriota bacterium]
MQIDRELRTGRPQPALPPARGLSFLIAAGGTGGHVLPGLQVAAELRARGAECTIVGTPRGMESKLAPQFGIPLEMLQIGPLNGVPWSRRIKTLVELPASVRQAARLVDRHRPAAALSLGGYASGPLVLAAIAKRVPLLIMEPNAYPGLANRLAARFARRALVGFDAAAEHLPSAEAETVGVPIRDAFFRLPRKHHVGAPLVLITGGSQGSSRLNQAAVAAAQTWAKQGFPGGIRLLHQTGPADYNGVRAAYDALRDATEIACEAVSFIDDMPAAFGRADLIVCRAGASTLAELAAAGKASILVPYPHAADDHQMRNARSMAQAGAARVAADAEWDGERMVREVGCIFGAPGRLEAMEDAARGLAKPGAAARVADALIEEALKRKS